MKDFHCEANTCGQEILITQDKMPSEYFSEQLCPFAILTECSIDWKMCLSRDYMSVYT